MEGTYRELTGREKKRIKKLITSRCANYDKEYGCLPLDKERSAVDRVKSAYGEKYDLVMMHDSKRDVTDLLGEETTVRSIREHLQKKREQKVERKKTSKKT